jgi:hypothetical protein
MAMDRQKRGAIVTGLVLAAIAVAVYLVTMLKLGAGS